MEARAPEVALRKRTMETPVGRIVIVEENQAITRLTWQDEVADDASPLLAEAVAQLDAYFNDRLEEFDLPFGFDCSPFQKLACEAMCDIPYGKTVTYGELANTMNSAAQPVGNACGGNPIAILVPCHRVLGATDMGGYSGEGGVETKITLLRLENAIPWLI